MTDTKVRLPQELTARIDVARGAVPRERWVRLVLEQHLDETEAAPIAGAVPSESSR